MALADTADVEQQLGRPLTTDEDTVIDARLRTATNLVIGYCHQRFGEPLNGTDPQAVPDSVPRAVRDVTAEMVARAFDNAGTQVANVDEVRAGSFSARFATGTTATKPWLSSSDKTQLAPWRIAISSIGGTTGRFDEVEL